jgi:hypothetical protein
LKWLYLLLVQTSITKSTDGGAQQQRPTAALSPSSTGSGGGNKGQQQSNNAQWEHPTPDERQVTVTGNCEQQYRVCCTLLLSIIVLSFNLFFI